MKQYEQKLVGHIAVDAGICMVGDPCYVLKDEGEERYPGIGKTWGDFVNLLYEEDGTPANNMQLYFDKEKTNAGLGVVVQSGYGDGYYPVYIRKNSEGRVIEVTVKFDENEDDEGIESDLV